MVPASLSVSRQVEAVSSMWTASAPGSKVCKPDARSGVHWNFHTGVAEDQIHNGIGDDFNST